MNQDAIVTFSNSPEEPVVIVILPDTSPSSSPDQPQVVGSENVHWPDQSIASTLRQRFRGQVTTTYLFHYDTLVIILHC